MEHLEVFFQKIQFELGIPFLYRFMRIEPQVCPENLEYLKSFYPGQDFGKRFSSEIRLQQWVSSRCALHKIQESLPIAQDQKWLFSISHTRDYAVVCGLRVQKDEALSMGIGIDLERPGRTLSQKALHRIFSSEELDLPLSSLALWTMKEAAFKALQEKGLVLPQLRVISWNPEQLEGEVISLRSQLSCRVRLFESQEVILSFAFWMKAIPNR